MKELFRERDLTKVTFYQSLLEAAEIPTFIKNENLSTTEGVSIPDFFPALCVVHSEDYDRAYALIKEHLEETEKLSGTEITCPNCGETSPGNFGACWNCQSPLTQE
ncbi:MAG: DUF2007 domain-containing protein [Akkermansiaceae bacterium]|jgi:hypothetical protein|nr:DUF2007 domain-containing protein [Akkermansiaceae bacterium]MDP4647362.1 DUF2007 domain-containing protein [Akkermansiaceae bacterium]MDP4720952.1 DUF2007 domain-containing protein [Akkermansiaceae bacterium]MDP4779514.1 DUF2007 domain-containing protein [Akkermansiaceae bacterium]MDP4847332.1 DUF2007 domain-containing protein [Akkermansiaceae bacterium]